ncbi:MAG: alginate lyase family protein [Dysgonamonadaceae bacterium]|nr:alginate lyase family protein [Dysgonamonadaceae bacterium]
MKKTVLSLICIFFVINNFTLQAQGFIHPGALHTQADFDRVKALIAANDAVVVQAYNKLKNSEYAKSTVTTYPVERIVRGGGSGENYMNAARGGAMAYQNALHWKLSGEKAHADKAVQILNAWASVCKSVGGDTNQSLASGLYGYAFANAAELMRDYEGWRPADFKKFKEWMLQVWYPRCIDFLRRRHDTWSQGTPGHYWSNWGLCNVVAVMSIGILCDDVFIYNQGLSFYKHDQVGNYTGNQTSPLDNRGLTEFLGNLVPAVHADSRGPLGYLGQMQESGRDQGHALMALGLAIDVCQIGWNQGDDLFAFMDNRLAAGIEYVAAYNSGVNDLPWTDYWYHDVRTSYNNSWKQTGNNEGGRNAFRPYWDRVIGHYEGIKGIDMLYSHAMRDKEPVDGGGGNYGQTSGGFDHLGFSTLMNYHPQKADASQAPVTLKPVIIYNNKTYNQSELGGLTNTYSATANPGITKGSAVTLSPQLPDGVTDSGDWQWNTGEATRERAITADSSAIYRVTYTHSNGVKSTQVFSIAVTGDCSPDKLTPAITVNEVTYNDTIITILPQTTFQLSVSGSSGWGKYKWNNGATTSSITVNNISNERTYSLVYTNQGGAETQLNFHIKLSLISPSLSVNGAAVQNTNTAIISAGQSVELKPIVQSGKESGVWTWSNGNSSQNLLLENVQNSEHHSVSYVFDGKEYTLDFHIYVIVRNKGISDGDYYIKNASNGKYLTNSGSPVFDNFMENTPEQVWTITRDGARSKIVSKSDNRFLNENGVFSVNPYYTAWNSYTFHGVDNGNLYAIQNGGSAGTNYWTINSDGSINGKGATSMTALPFEIISIQTTGIPNPGKGKYRIYPNPVTDRLIVNIASGAKAKGTFAFYSVGGQQVKTFLCAAGENQLPVGNFPQGMYVGILEMDGKTEHFKILKR